MDNGYNTLSRKKILAYLQESQNQMVSVAQIDQYLKSEGSPVSITTIYRFLDRLTKEGTVIKYTSEEGDKAVYQFVQGHHCDEHLHLKCVVCGEILHMECEFMDVIKEHIEEHHGFELQCKNSILYGICSKCRKREKNDTGH